MTDRTSGREAEPARPLDNNRTGILFMLLAMACLIGSDTLMKLASQHIPVGQAIFLRGLGLVPLLMVAALLRGELRRMREILHPMVALRTFGEVSSTACYMSALARLPLANATAILQLVPLLSVVAAALVLDERVGARRWIAVALGLAAVLLIIRPGMAGFDAWSLVAILAALFMTLRDVSSRRLPPGTSPILVSLAAALAVSILSLGMVPFEDWGAVTWRGGIAAVAAAPLLAVAYFALVQAMRHGEVPIVAPYRYTIVLWAVLIQFAVFGVAPGLMTLVGASLLVASGTYSFLRERRVMGRAGAAGAPVPR